MRAILVAVLLVGTSPALAENCPYVNEAGDRVAFLDDGENTVTIERATGAAACDWARSEDGPTIACDDGSRLPFWFIPATRGGTSQDILIYADDAWYRSCA